MSDAREPGPNPAPNVERVLHDLANAPSALERWRDGAECPSPHVLAAFAEGRLQEVREAEVRAHLARCGACVADVRAALEELGEIAAETPVDDTAPGRDQASPGRLRLVSSVPLWIGLAAAAVLLVLFGPFGRGDGGREKAIQLARVEAIAARIPRGSADEAELAFRAGLVDYVAERWTAAEATLRRAGELAPERTDVALYRGSTLLLLQRPDEALPLLELARTAEGRAGREARWQHAQALLAAGRIEAAVEELEGLADGGHRAEEAGELRAELRAVGF